MLLSASQAWSTFSTSANPSPHRACLGGNAAIPTRSVSEGERLADGIGNGTDWSTRPRSRFGLVNRATMFSAFGEQPATERGRVSTDGSLIEAVSKPTRSVSEGERLADGIGNGTDWSTRPRSRFGLVTQGVPPND